jgi:hypothetical protein
MILEIFVIIDFNFDCRRNEQPLDMGQFDSCQKKLAIQILPTRPHNFHKTSVN